STPGSPVRTPGGIVVVVCSCPTSLPVLACPSPFTGPALPAGLHLPERRPPARCVRCHVFHDCSIYELMLVCVRRTAHPGFPVRYFSAGKAGCVFDTAWRSIGPPALDGADGSGASIALGSNSF